MDNSADLAALRARCEALRREQAELERFALIGQAFLGLAHELNNSLNSMMLQTSVVQLRVDEQARQELAAIRQHGAQAAGMLRALQHVAQEQREFFYLVDLNNVLVEVLEEDAELRRRVSPSLCEKAPQIHSTRSTVKQMVRLLLEGVCTGKDASVKAATCEREGDAVLELTIAGANGEATNAEALLWRNLDEVGWLAGQSLLRQLGGALTIERNDGAATLLITWKQYA
ncbi:MAG TPA: hypothetical protein VMF69_14190 [Gemmataceae bacterium]|nr:hypothetical protein [Gemmataceae bacterium]